MLARFQMIVKNQIHQSLSEPSKGGPESLFLVYSSKFWLIYFLFSILVVGSFLVLGLYFPFFFLALIFPSLKKYHELVLVRGINFLLKIQFWLNAKVNLELPSQKVGTAGRLLISNHRSHFDVFILLAHVQGIKILAKSSLFFIPFLGIMMRVTGQIPISRGHLDSFLQALEKVRHCLRAGQTIHIFPEMTRCAWGHQGTLHFSIAPFHIAIQEKIQIFPIVFINTDQAWPKSYLGILYRKPLRAQILRPIDSSQFQSAELLCKEVKKRIDNELSKAMELRKVRV